MIKNSIHNIIDLIDSAIHIDADKNIMGGNIIKSGYNSEIDRYRSLVLDSKDWLDSYRSGLIEKTGITSLKIKYTSASGYFIEIPKSQIGKIMENFVQKQSLVNASRYITPELISFEKDIASAEGKMAEKEYEIFGEIRNKILEQQPNIRDLSLEISELDYVCGLSQLAYMNKYVKPEMTNTYDLHIQGGRHPVVETMAGDFISNDLSLQEKECTHIITGPNMGGKSTFLRQNALIILLAHMGSFVPAKKALIPITDKIFSRIGASDNLYLGQSTFMVEMQEVANILNNSTKKSFVIIDEVGRGTSTYDGMSLARAILKENHDNIGAKTLFSTHYHELCEEAKDLRGVKNFSVAVGENSESIVFLRKIISGAINKSYGLEVARLAGIHERVISESKQMLIKLQSGQNKQLSLAMLAEHKKDIQPDSSQVEEELKKLDINSLTPLEGLMKLQEMQNML